MSRRARMGLIGIALVAIIALGWFFLLSPVRDNIASTTSQVDDARRELAASQAKLAQAEATREEGRRNQSRLIELAKMMPSEEQIPSLLVQIQDLAAQSGIDFMSITPGSPMDFVLYRVIPLSLEFTGTYFDLSDFIYRTEQLVATPGRLLGIKQLGLELGEGEGEVGDAASVAAGPVLRVAMTLYAFDNAVAMPEAAPPVGGPPAVNSGSGGS